MYGICEEPRLIFLCAHRPLPHQHVNQWELRTHLEHQVCSLIKYKIMGFQILFPRMLHVLIKISSYWSTLKLSIPLLHYLFFIFCWGQNVSNGHIALPETVRFCQTKKIKPRPCHKNTAFEPAGYTSKTGLTSSCAPSWHFNIGQMLIQSITKSKISQATSVWADTAKWFGVSGVFQPPVRTAGHKTRDNEQKLAPEEKFQLSELVFSCFLGSWEKWEFFNSFFIMF